MLEFKSYDVENVNTTIPFKLPEGLKSIYFSYDGGRVCVSINGEQVFYTGLGGNDCQVEIVVD